MRPELKRGLREAFDVHVGIINDVIARFGTNKSTMLPVIKSEVDVLNRLLKVDGLLTKMQRADALHLLDLIRRSF